MKNISYDDLEVGDLYIHAPIQADYGHGGFQPGHYLFEKSGDGARRLLDGGITQPPPMTPVLKVVGKPGSGFNIHDIQVPDANVKQTAREVLKAVRKEQKYGDERLRQDSWTDCLWPLAVVGLLVGFGVIIAYVCTLA